MNGVGSARRRGLRWCARLAVVLGVLTWAAGASAATPVGQWTFDEGTGTTAADRAGTHPATLTTGATWTTGVVGPSALSLNGSGFANAGAPILDGTKSFSVSAWVKLNQISGFQTAVSIDGTTISNFFLGLRDDTKRFAFVRLASDAPQGGVIAGGSTDPVANRWYLLTGVYDAGANTLNLYVNGKLQSSQPAPTAWAATGNLVIGRGKYGGGNVDFVSGAIDDVRAYQAALTPDEIAELVNAGSWRLDEGTGTTAADDSTNQNTLTLNAGASWTAGAVGTSALQFNGTTGAAEAPGPIVDTSQAFSVAAWVKTDVTNGFRTAVSIDGAQVSSFFLQKRDDNRFAFTRLPTDAPGTASFAASTATARAGQWYHLVGVYDGTSLTLYVNGTKQQSVAAPTAWKAAGHLVLGRGRYSGAAADFWQGAVDDVRTFPVAIDDATAAALASSGSWHFDENAGTTARDDSPARDHGTLAAPTWTQGVAGSAVAAAVDMGAAPSLNLGAGSGSLSAWVKATGDGVIAAKGDGYSLSIAGGKLRARFGTTEVTSPQTYTDNNFHHVAATLDRDAGKLTLYADGDAVAGATAAPGSADGTGHFVAAQGVVVDELAVSRFALTAAQVAGQAGTNAINIDATDVRATIPKTLYGSILEDISHSVEGGLYAELVRNRAFKESGSGTVPYWTLLQQGGATGSFAIDTTQPLNSALDRSLKLTATANPAGGRVAAYNEGFWGVKVTPSTTYTGSLFTKTSTFTGRVRISLEKADGTVIASAAVTPAAAWARQTFTLTTPANAAESINNRIVVALEGGTGDVNLTQISLFPPTYKNHGLRMDIMQKLADLKLGLFRVPGGNYLEGNTLDTRFQWKNTIGPDYTRPGHQNTAWGYWSSDGMGILSYLQMAEDLGAQPLLAVFAGYTLNGQHVSEDAYQQYIDDALDEIEYAIGDASTTWGAKRVADGHPAPFDIHYIEIGNEDWFDTSGAYSWRYTRMAEAIRARYPKLKLIATTGGLQGGNATTISHGSGPVDVLDDHYYQSPQWFYDNANRYDTASRNGARILIGEYGATEGNPTGNLRSALGEAAFLTGIERNSDAVIGSMFAPVLVNENAINWGTNLIGIDAAGSYGSPSYWIEKLFADYTGKQVLQSNVSGSGGLKQVVSKTTEGGRTTFYIKVVNFSNQQQSARLNFTGVSRLDGGDMTTLTGDPNVRNTLANPTAIAPGPTRPLSNLALDPRFTFPGSSVNLIKLVGVLGDPGVPPTSVTPDPVDVGGSVPATLALTLGATPEFGAFTPGVTKDYEASTTATVTSTAGDAALSVSDPGHLMNGTFALPEPLQVALTPASWTGPVSNAAVSIAFKQRVNANDPLRTGRYSKSLTFTLSTTRP